MSGQVLDKPTFAFISSSVDDCTNHQATSAHAECWWQIIWGKLKARLIPWAPCNSPWVIPEQCLLCSRAHCYAEGGYCHQGVMLPWRGSGGRWISSDIHMHARIEWFIAQNTLHCNGTAAIMHFIYLCGWLAYFKTLPLLVHKWLNNLWQLNSKKFKQREATFSY